jgi:hypothetical protein
MTVVYSSEDPIVVAKSVANSHNRLTGTYFQQRQRRVVMTRWGKDKDNDDDKRWQ